MAFSLGFSLYLGRVSMPDPKKILCGSLFLGGAVDLEGRLATVGNVFLVDEDVSARFCCDDRPGRKEPRS